MKTKKYFFAALFLGFLLLNVQIAAAAATKNIGESCARTADCKSGFCGESASGSLVCAGTVGVGNPCSTTDQKKACAAGLRCAEDGYSFVCVEETRNGTPVPETINNSGNSQGSRDATFQNPSNCGPTQFCNPLAFKTVDGFLTHVLTTLQRIIVVVALVMIVIGAIQYITSAGGKQVDTAKKTITAALVGLAIAIAAPSFLKEISLLLGWNAESETVQKALTLTQIAMNVLNFLLSVLGVLALVMLVLAGIMYTTAATDSKKAEDGKKMAQYAIIGVIVAMSSMIMLQQVAKFFVN